MPLNGTGSPEVASRPTQLGRPILVLLAIVLGLSFTTGLGLWHVHAKRENLEDIPAWASACRTIHGLLNPVICFAFGCLWLAHVRGGWKMRANWKTGFLLTAAFTVLILSGAALYYAANSGIYFVIHLAAGLTLPIIVLFHGWFARQWAKSK